MESTSTTTPGPSDLAYLEEYADTVVSLPHEIQRNFTLIREHDAKVRDLNDSLYVNVDKFLSPSANVDKNALLTAIKGSFLATLTHAEEKVSLASQCFNTVEKHLVKLEEDLKCFEEEIRLAGYEELLVPNRPAKKQTTNASMETSTQRANRKRSREVNNSTSSSSTNAPSTPTTQPKRPRRASVVEAGEAATDSDSQQQQQLSRAERLLRRSKPAFAVDENVSKNEENEGDDEAEAGEVENGSGVDEEVESAVEDESQSQSQSQNEALDESASTAPVPQEPDEPRRTTRSRSNSISNPPPPSATSANEPLYCTCKRVSFGQMIACDNKDCPTEWFHYGCVGLKNPPKGKWYCCVTCQNGKSQRRI